MDLEQLNWANVSIPKLEENIVDYWRKIDAINVIINESKGKPEKIFIDGPPFANGTIHWGHFLVSTLKDTLTRYFTMRGFNVDRGFGWDTHGVPMEMLAKKIIGYKTKQELLEYGIDKHNNVCRQLVDKCATQWYKDFERMGRWVDKSREYKTMDKKYMESVIYIFKELYQKGMIFEGFKVMPYSTGCNTAFSHFEAKQNYKDITDTSVICCFKLTGTEYSTFKHHTTHPTYILAWTTTPWSLPGNLALCTGKNISIVHVFDNQLNAFLLMSNSAFEKSYAKMKFKDTERFRVVEKIIGSDLLNARYVPPFTDLWDKIILSEIAIESSSFRILCDPYVKESGEESGTGFVQLNPSHGEDDFRICMENGIIDNKNTFGFLINLINDDGCFVQDISDYAGVYFKDADKMIIRNLKSKNLLFDSKPYAHSYPYCYRTDTPLIYRLVTGWFLNASNEEFRKKMLENNSKINWMPSNIGTNHFDNWLQNSVDWCISRSRYWGTPIPVWKSDDGEEIVCIGSVSELCGLAGMDDIKDLHIENLDTILLPSKMGKGMLKRVDGVLDCWFESGSVPYGQIHYPFDNKDKFDDHRDHIADFISESKDQTRGWFYTLTVLATALFNKPAFKNVIVTGIILGSDGEKISKSKGNYTDPNILMNMYGADVIRLYLLSTPLVKAESFQFDDVAVAKLVQNSVVKIYNIALMLIEKINLFGRSNSSPIIFPAKKDIESFSNILDRWIINKTGLLLQNISKDFDMYTINGVSAKIIEYIEQLTNWYVKMARERLKGTSNSGTEDWKQSIQTLLFVLLQFIKIVAPIMPFISETIYLMLAEYIPNTKQSIHFENYPCENEFVFENTLEKKFATIQKIIILIREIRDINRISNRRPILCAEIGSVGNDCLANDILEYIQSESNVMGVKKLDLNGIVFAKAEANAVEIKEHLKNLGKLKFMQKIILFVNNLNELQIKELETNSQIIEPESGIVLHKKLINLKYLLKNLDPHTKISNNLVVKLDTSYTEQVKHRHLTKLVNIAIQKYRKDKNLKPWHVIDIYYTSDDLELINFIETHNENFISKNISNIEVIQKEYIDLYNDRSKYKIENIELEISSIILLPELE